MSPGARPASGPPGSKVIWSSTPAAPPLPAGSPPDLTRSPRPRPSVNHEITQANGLVAARPDTFRLVETVCNENVDERVASVQPVRLIRYTANSWPPARARKLRFCPAILGQNRTPRFLISVRTRSQYLAP